MIGDLDDADRTQLLDADEQREQRTFERQASLVRAVPASRSGRFIMLAISISERCTSGKEGLQHVYYALFLLTLNQLLWMLHSC